MWQVRWQLACEFRSRRMSTARFAECTKCASRIFMRSPGCAPGRLVEVEFLPPAARSSPGPHEHEGRKRRAARVMGSPAEPANCPHESAHGLRFGDGRMMNRIGWRQGAGKIGCRVSGNATRGYGAAEDSPMQYLAHWRAISFAPRPSTACSTFSRAGAFRLPISFQPMRGNRLSFHPHELGVGRDLRPRTARLGMPFACDNFDVFWPAAAPAAFLLCGFPLLILQARKLSGVVVFFARRLSTGLSSYLRPASGHRGI